MEMKKLEKSKLSLLPKQLSVFLVLKIWVNFKESWININLGQSSHRKNLPLKIGILDLEQVFRRLLKLL